MTSAIFQSVTVRSLGQRCDIPPCLLDSSSSPVTERGEDECPDARATDGDSGDDGPLLVEVLRDAVQPGQVDDAQPQADQAARAEVEEVDVGSHGAQHQTCSSQFWPPSIVYIDVEIGEPRALLSIHRLPR